MKKPMLINDYVDISTDDKRQLDKVLEKPNSLAIEQAKSGQFKPQYNENLTKSSQMSPEERKAFILSQQSQSTQRALTSNKPLYNAPWPPKGAIANPNAKTLAEAVGQRNISVDEFTVEERRRRQAKNYEGQQNNPTLKLETAERAANAFVFSSGQTLKPNEEMKPSKLESIETIEIITKTAITPISTQKSTFWTKLKNFFGFDHL